MIDTDIVSAQLSSSEAGDQLSNMSTSDAFADSNPPIYGFNVLQQFNGLTSKEKFYAHYMSKYGQLHFFQIPWIHYSMFRLILYKSFFLRHEDHHETSLT
jgi:hypothetical protein